MNRQRRERLRDWVLGQPGMDSVRINSHDLIELLDYIDDLETERRVSINEMIGALHNQELRND